jgi:APA family basic amino acid/polyamine antiporter
MNYVGVRTAGRFQVLLTILKVAALASILGLGFAAAGSRAGEPSVIASPVHGALIGFLTALVPVMAAYNGFQFLGSVGGEVSPKRNIPRAVILGTSLVIFYMS